uniref:Achaete-Scute a-like1 basic helix-loop-helix transcription factor protein n=1 Tax=Phallusia mammillata TaxID=59560 RepID=A0A6F9D7H3_9ASCI|nr:Achaete-Scute a-like1 basic helix-loop-helix transcription factor protein [Phallusia mammillata]
MTSNDQNPPSVGNQFVSYAHMMPVYNQDVIFTAPEECSSSHPTPPVKNVVSVARRNARERRRIKHVNSAFDDLRKRVPTGNDYRKISKVETLRSAIEYIKALEAIVERQETEVTSSHVTSSTNQDPSLEGSPLTPQWQPQPSSEAPHIYPMYPGNFAVQTGNKITKESFPAQDNGEGSMSYIRDPETPLPYQHEGYFNFQHPTIDPSSIYS